MLPPRWKGRACAGLCVLRPPSQSSGTPASWMLRLWTTFPSDQAPLGTHVQLNSLFPRASLRCWEVNALSCRSWVVWGSLPSLVTQRHPGKEPACWVSTGGLQSGSLQTRGPGQPGTVQSGLNSEPSLGEKKMSLCFWMFYVSHLSQIACRFLNFNGGFISLSFPQMKTDN